MKWVAFFAVIPIGSYRWKVRASSVAAPSRLVEQGETVWLYLAGDEDGRQYMAENVASRMGNTGVIG